MEGCPELPWYSYLHRAQPCPHFGAIQGRPISHFMTPDEELQTRRPGHRRLGTPPPQVSGVVHDRVGIAHSPLRKLAVLFLGQVPGLVSGKIVNLGPGWRLGSRFRWRPALGARGRSGTWTRGGGSGCPEGRGGDGAGKGWEGAESFAILFYFILF